MELKQLEKRMEMIMEDISCLAGNICVLKALDIRQNPKKYEKLSIDTALSAEKIACKLRSLIYATTQVRKYDYLVRAGEAQSIEIEQKNGVWQITLPCLLPKKKSRQSDLFLGDPLYVALENYTMKNRQPPLEQCVVCFCHVYAWDRPLPQIPDSDNLQQKMVLDLVSLFFLIDDNGLLCSTHTMAERGEHTHTRVYVMAKERFPQWLAEHEKEREKEGQNRAETI